LQYQLDNYEAGEDPHRKMNVLQALRWATEAWREDVTETTIANCWLKSRVLKGQMTPPTKCQAQQMGWQEAVKQDEDSYIHVVNLAREAIKELANRQFIKEGQNVATFLDPPDEIIEDDPEDTGFIEPRLMPVCLTPILTGQKYPFLSLFLCHRHSVQLAPCGPLSSNKRRTILSSFGS
jgi:hypothetical protein